MSDWDVSGPPRRLRPAESVPCQRQRRVTVGPVSLAGGTQAENLKPLSHTVSGCQWQGVSVTVAAAAQASHGHTVARGHGLVIDSVGVRVTVGFKT
jgi:hypothetical protein